MSVLNFAEDFTRLVVRYTKAPSPNNELSKDAIVPLNYHQITNTIYQVFSALGIRDCNDNSEFLKTPVNAIDVLTPTAPVVSKINRNDHDDFRSDDTLAAITDFTSSVSDTSLTTNEKEVKNSVNGLQNEKKFLSRSNPMICINNIGRSDTFVCDKKQETNTDDTKDVFLQESFQNAEKNYPTSNILKSLNEVQKSIMNVVKKVEQIKKEAFPQMAKQTRRLSSGGFSSVNYTSAPNKTNLSTKILRRSITSGTPTSSRSLSIERENIFDRRKSTGEGKCCAVTPGKLSESKKLGHSTSNLNLSQSKVSSDLATKLTKNSKYAHVQSTIPKPTQMKKKVQ